MSRTVPLNSRYIMLIDLHSPVTYQKWVMAATMDPLGIQGVKRLSVLSTYFFVSSFEWPLKTGFTVHICDEYQNLMSCSICQSIY